MKDDFDIIQREFDEEIFIVPIFDVHYGAENFNEKEWKRTKDFIMKTPNCYCVFGGDIIDNQTKNSHSPFGGKVRPFEQREWYKKQVYELSHIKKEDDTIENKILCGTVGNHTKRKDNVASDDSIDFDVFENAGIEDLFRPNMCFIKIKLGDRNDYDRQTYMLVVTHGSGGGNTIGSPANKNAKASKIFSGIDAYITGHTHKPLNFPTVTYEFDSKNNKVSIKTVQVIVSPSYLDYGEYALAQQLEPAPYEDKVLKLTKRKNKKIIISNDYDFIRG